MFHQKHGDAEFFLNKVDEFHETDFLRGVHAGGGLIEQKQAWAGGQSAHDLQSALVSVRQIGRLPVGVVFQPKDFEERENLAANAFLFGAECQPACERVDDAMAQSAIHGCADIVENSQRTEEADVLECAGDSQCGDAVGLLVVE